MNFETLLQAAEFVESSSGPTTKENQSNARGNISSHVFVDRRRVVSESDASERRRRPGGAGTRETHNKLEKNRRAHLKECFDVLKREVPTLEEKKTSNLNILRSAFKYIQTMKKEEEEHETEVDVLKMNNKTLAERLGALKTKTKLEQKASASRSTTTENATSLLLKNPTFLLAESVDSRVPPISVATQTTPNLEKDGTQVSSVTDLEEVSNTCVSTSSTDTGVEGDEADSKISICDDDDDEKTDTDDGCYDDDDDDNDIEIDVVGQDDSSSSDSLRIAVESATAQGKINGEMDSEKRKGSSGSTNKKASKFTRKRSKSERKCEEADSDYDENTKEEPKAKIQACARVSV